jgi:preprotein translocase subunit SecE
VKVKIVENYGRKITGRIISRSCMSRLHKKISSEEKKKKRADSTDEAVSAEGDNKISRSKSATAASPVKAKSDKNLADVNPGEPNVFQRAMEFLREVKVELKKVTWPTQKQTTGTTIVVIIFVFVVSAFLGLFDLGLSKLVQVFLT